MRRFSGLWLLFYAALFHQHNAETDVESLRSSLETFKITEYDNIFYSYHSNGEFVSDHNFYDSKSTCESYGGQLAVVRPTELSKINTLAIWLRNLLRLPEIDLVSTCVVSPIWVDASWNATGKVDVTLPHTSIIL